MSTMNTGSRSTFLFMWFIHITIQVLEAQYLKVPPEVTGYLGHNVTLPCNFIPGPREDRITQVQWDVKQTEGQRIIIVVFIPMYGLLVQETSLKGRVEMAEQSLVIKDVEMGDAGSYTCSVATFTSGAFDGTTNLVAREQTMWLPRMIAAGVFGVMVVTMLATTCLA